MKPITRVEVYLANAGGEDVDIPEPITREEIYLKQICDNIAALGGGGGSGGGGGGGEGPGGGGGDGEGYIPVVVNATNKVPQFKADGTLESTGFSLGCNVPPDAVFTDCKVAQESLPNSGYYPVLFGRGGTEGAYQSSSLQIDASHNVIECGNTIYITNTNTISPSQFNFPPLSIGAASTNHIEVSATEIMAKGTSNTAASITINRNGGDVVIGAAASGNIPATNASLTVNGNEVLTEKDIVVCTQSQYDQMQTHSAMLYFIKEA